MAKARQRELDDKYTYYANISTEWLSSLPLPSMMNWPMTVGFLTSSMRALCMRPAIMAEAESLFLILPLHPPHHFSTFSPPSVYAFPNVGATNDVLEKMLVNKNVWSTAVTRRNTHQSFESWLSKEGKTTNKSRDEEAAVSMVRSVEVTEEVELSMSRCGYGSSAVRVRKPWCFLFFVVQFTSAVVSAIVRMCPHFCVVSACVRIASASCPHVSALFIWVTSHTQNWKVSSYTLVVLSMVLKKIQSCGFDTIHDTYLPQFRVPSCIALLRVDQLTHIKVIWNCMAVFHVTKLILQWYVVFL